MPGRHTTSRGLSSPSRAIAQSSLLLAAAALLAISGCSSEDRRSTSAFCAQLRDLPNLADAVSGYPDADTKTLNAQLATIRVSFADLAQAAPSSIRGDVRYLAEVVDVVAQTVQDKGIDPEAVQAELRHQLAKRPGLTKRSDKVDKWAKQNCDLDLNP